MIHKTIHGDEFHIDESDYELVSKYRWRLATEHGRKRSVRASTVYDFGGTGKRGNLAITFLLLGRPPEGFQIDHIDGDPLNNRRSNLRVCSKRQNMFNRGMNRNNTTGYKGVIRARGNRYRAQIRADGKKVTKGWFSSPEDAARAYDELPLQYHGVYGSRNFS